MFMCVFICVCSCVFHLCVVVCDFIDFSFHNTRLLNLQDHILSIKSFLFLILFRIKHAFILVMSVGMRHFTFAQVS